MICRIAGFCLRCGGFSSVENSFPLATVLIPRAVFPLNNSFLPWYTVVYESMYIWEQEGQALMELITWVSSGKALRAAVAAGADAVRIGVDGFGAAGIPSVDFEKAAAWCRARGVRLSAGMELPVSPARFDSAVSMAEALCRLGVDSVTVGDLGFLRALRMLLPEISLHAAPSLAVSDPAGAKLLAAVGATRLMLPQQLSAEELTPALMKSGAETEVTVCGSGCAAFGLCRLDAFCGEAAADAACARTCRTRLVSEGTRAAAEDLFLGEDLEAIRKVGVHAVCIRCEGRSPEFAAMATDIFRRALRDGRAPSEGDTARLKKAFFPDGFGSSYYRGEPAAAHASVSERSVGAILRSRAAGVLIPSAAEEEYQRVPVRLRAEVSRGTFSRIIAEDMEGHSAGATGPVPASASENARALTAPVLRTQLFNTMGTPFVCTDAEVKLEPGLYLSGAELGRMRREALGRLLERREKAPDLHLGSLPPLRQIPLRREPPDITISVSRAEQLSEELAALKPKILYLPLAELLRMPSSVTPFWEAGTAICPVLPARYPAGEAPELFTRLRRLKDYNIADVRIESLNGLLPLRTMDFHVHCGPGIAVDNGRTLRVLEEVGVVSAVLSPELTLDRIRAIPKCIDTELFAYGRLPLLVSEQPPAQDGETASLRDRSGRMFPIEADGGRSRLLSPDKLFLGDRLHDLEGLGLWCLQLSFTTENAAECVSVAERYLNLGSYVPNFRTKGFYYENESDSGLRLSAKAGASRDARHLFHNRSARKK